MEDHPRTSETRNIARESARARGSILEPEAKEDSRINGETARAEIGSRAQYVNRGERGASVRDIPGEICCSIGRRRASRMRHFQRDISRE